MGRWRILRGHGPRRALTNPEDPTDLQRPAGSIAGISLLIRGIGIMNVVLADVSRRTREIGIRRAIGAQRRDVPTQFLIETVFICLTGGAIGIFLGFGMAKTITLMQLGTGISLESVIIAFGTV